METVAQRIAEAPQEVREPTEEKTLLRAISINDFLKLSIPAREYIMEPWLQTQAITMLFGKRGIGKTLVGLGIAFAVARGGEFLRWKATKPRRVLYVDGEMPAATMQERLAALISDPEPPSPDYLRIITPDIQEFGIPDLTTEEGQKAIEEHLEGVELVVLDNLSTLCRGGRENESESWEPIQTWTLGLRRRGIATLFVHHAGKSGQQRGTSRREDVLDTVIRLQHPADWSPDQGAKFEVHYDKARGVFGEDARPFEAELGAGGWTFLDLEQTRTRRVADLHNDGLKQREIKEELGIGIATVNRHIKKAREQGLLN